MFRSLFIGLLLVSALTSKGATVQINQNIINHSSDMLLEIFNAAAAYADKQTELSVARPNGVFLNNASGRSTEIEEILRTIRQNSPVVWIESGDKSICTNPRCGQANMQQKPFCKGEVYTCGTDLSPPCC